MELGLIDYERLSTYPMTCLDVCLQATPSLVGDDLPFVFLLGYLIFALVVISAEELFRKGGWHLPLVVDLAALIVFLFISPSEVAIWFPYLFVAFAAGIRWGLHRAIVLAGAVSLALVVRVAVHGV